MPTDCLRGNSAMSSRRLTLLPATGLMLLTGLLSWSDRACGEENPGHETKVLTRPAAATGPVAKPPELSKVEGQIVEQTNAFRQQQKLPAVTVDDELAKAARYFAEYMARTSRYSHTADGSQPAERAKKHGYSYCLVTENIAYQFNSAGFTSDELADGFFTGWKNSPGHRKNMLDDAVTDTAVAVAHSGETGYFFAVQLFGLPKSAQFQFQVVNSTTAALEYLVGEQKFTLPPRYRQTHTHCQSTTLKVLLPDGEGTTRKQEFTPKKDQQFVVQGDSGKLEVRQSTIADKQ